MKANVSYLSDSSGLKLQLGVKGKGGFGGGFYGELCSINYALSSLSIASGSQVSPGCLDWAFVKGPSIVNIAVSLLLA